MSEKFKRRLFGTDGIRGQANNGKLTAELALRVGQAAGILFRQGQHEHKVLVGKDTRLSCYMIESCLVGGFTSAGMNVLQTGPLPTPGVAALTRSMRCDLGVMISASHNPYDDNGIKLFDSLGHKLSDEKELEIERLIANPAELSKLLPKGAQMGRAKRIDGVQDRYIEFAKRALPRTLQFNDLRVVIDCANGAGYKVAPQALQELGAEVIAINHEPSGININDECGSTHPDSLRRKVIEVRADIGIALDGDADRVLLVDEAGVPVDGDQILALIAESLKKEKKLRGKVVGTIMSNGALETHLSSLGIGFTRTKVGDRYILEEMVKSDCNLGGEPSGHVILSDHATTGDGLVAALQVLAMLKELGEPASKVLHRFEALPQVIKNCAFKGEMPGELSSVKKAIDAGHRTLGRRARISVRKSGTEPKARVMVEGRDRGRVEEVANSIIQAIEART